MKHDETLDDAALDQLFREARSQNKWLDREVTEAQLHALYDLMKWAPTSANGFPQRIVFAKTADAKERVASAAMEGNREKIRTAPVTAVLGYDLEFFRKMDELFPHDPSMPRTFAEDEELAELTAFRNGTLQGAYFLLAARSLGLDCGPMSGFDNDRMDELFFAGTTIRSNFLCAIGYGDPDGLFDRLPRPDFDEVCRIL